MQAGLHVVIALDVKVLDSAKSASKWDGIDATGGMAS